MSTVLESAICHLIEISSCSGCSVNGHITFVNNGNNQNYKANNNGETYGDGDLNIEINHFDEGHFGSVMATSTYNIKNKWPYKIEPN